MGKTYTQEEFDAALEQMRVSTLEEAAKVCEEQPRHSGDATTFYVATGQCAAAIRGLK